MAENLVIKVTPLFTLLAGINYVVCFFLLMTKRLLEISELLYKLTLLSLVDQLIMSHYFAFVPMRKLLCLWMKSTLILKQ